MRAPATLILDPDGNVVTTSGLPPAVARASKGSPCSDVMMALPGGEGLPCRDCAGSVGPGFGDAQKRRIKFREGSFWLACVNCGPYVVVVLTPQASRTPAAWERLTPREYDVLRLVADGLTTAEIAEALEISRATVRTHVEHMRVRMCVATRAELIARCFRVGLLE